jgi:hypothetical protein
MSQESDFLNEFVVLLSKLSSLKEGEGCSEKDSSKKSFSQSKPNVLKNNLIETISSNLKNIK